MNGFVMVVLNQKGGVGKSTICICLAVLAARYGLRVGLVEGDAHNLSVTSWHQDRNDESLPIALFDGPQALHQRIRGAAKTCDLVLVDTPGQQSVTHAEALLQADYVLVPLCPSGLDMKALHPTLRLVWGALRSRPALRAGIVLSRVQSVRDCRAVRNDLSRPRVRCGRCAEDFAGGPGAPCPTCRASDGVVLPSVPVLDTEISEKRCFKTCVTAGSGITEWDPESPYAAQFLSLYEEIGSAMTREPC